MKYDIIGDIHGHVVPLMELLHKLGYYNKAGYYQHPEGRKVIFVGDYIDRGPHIRETLQLVKAMTDNGSAEAIMGNHEYNALCFHLKDQDRGGHLRKHNLKNILQHEATIRQFQHHEKEWHSWIDWFMQLPLFIERENFRAVHACWDDKLIQHLRQHSKTGILSEQFVYSAQEPGTPNYEAVERTLKGKEEKLANGIRFHDKDGTERQEARIKWWKPGTDFTFDEYIFGDIEELKGKKIPPGTFKENNGYAELEVPVFFGHYWLKGEPVLQSDNVVCLDYSIAKGGKLVAYRYNGERVLRLDSLIF
jgi:hypothetical protein